jgi:hypothetical protein
MGMVVKRAAQKRNPATATHSDAGSRTPLFSLHMDCKALREADVPHAPHPVIHYYLGVIGPTDCLSASKNLQK